MKKLLIALLCLFPLAANAQTRLNNYQPGFRTIDGSQLNRMVAAVNNLQGTGTPGAVTGTTGVFTGSVTLNKIITGATPPALTSCGGSPTISGSDTAGRLVTGSAATTCTITFAAAYTGAPYCVISAEVATQPTYTVSTTAISFATSIASTAYHYHCIARSGG